MGLSLFGTAIDIVSSIIQDARGTAVLGQMIWLESGGRRVMAFRSEFKNGPGASVLSVEEIAVIGGSWGLESRL